MVREPLPPSTGISLEIVREESALFAGTTALERMKRSFTELVAFLFRDNEFPSGCFLLTGTGIVPPNDLTLRCGDEIRIRVDGLGTLLNRVA